MAAIARVPVSVFCLALIAGCAPPGNGVWAPDNAVAPDGAVVNNRAENACAEPEISVARNSVARNETATITVRGMTSTCADHWIGPVGGTLEPVGGMPTPWNVEAVWHQGDNQVGLGIVELDERGSGVFQFAVPASAEAGPASVLVGSARVDLEVVDSRD